MTNDEEPRWRTTPKAPFTQVPNTLARDATLSSNAVRIMVLVLSYPGDWAFTKDWIIRHSGMGKAAVQTALNELTARGYRQVGKRQDARGAWVTRAIWHMEPWTGAPSPLEDFAIPRADASGGPVTDGPETDGPETGVPETGPSNTEYGLMNTYKPPFSSPLTPTSRDLTVPGRSLAVADSSRPEIRELCDLMSRLLDDLGVKHTVGKKWHNDFRLMLDRDGRTPAQVAALTQWALQDGFWRSNIHSPGALRKQWDRLRLQATGGQRRREPTVAEQNMALVQALGDQPEGANPWLTSPSG